MEKEQSFKFSYESLWKFIIRPPRGNYKESDLGPKVFNRRNNKIVAAPIDLPHKPILPTPGNFSTKLIIVSKSFFS